jgi:hypothetical protein
MERDAMNPSGHWKRGVIVAFLATSKGWFRRPVILETLAYMSLAGR